jgi:formylglycine-generating enzyme required for sulfatase activity
MYGLGWRAAVVFLVALASVPSQDRLIQPKKDFTNSIGMKFIWLPPGTFLMGSPEDEEGRENEVQHKVTLTKGFYVGIHPVTQEEWQAVMGNNPSRHRGEKNLPVESVSWDE